MLSFRHPKPLPTRAHPPEPWLQTLDPMRLALQWARKEPTESYRSLLNFWRPTASGKGGGHCLHLFPLLSKVTLTVQVKLSGTQNKNP